MRLWQRWQADMRGVYMALGNAGSVLYLRDGRRSRSRIHKPPGWASSVTLQSLLSPAGEYRDLCGKGHATHEQGEQSHLLDRASLRVSDADDERKGEGRQEEDQQHS